MIKNQTITSEYVAYGHPDKLADRISDALLDAYITEYPNARCGIETMVKDNVVVVGGEVRVPTETLENVNVENIVRSVVESTRYPSSHGLTYDNIKVINLIGNQSAEISAGVDKENDVVGAGDQGFVVGYASNETETYMPLGHYLAKEICDCIAHCGSVNFGPDVKTQVTVDYYENCKAIVKQILVSTLHSPELSIEDVREQIKQKILTNPIASETYTTHIKENIQLKILVNPCGTWNIGGPISDCGLTGRKIVVDSYGGYCNVGGGAFSGKDMSKVDRSGAYMARYLAKNIVAAGISDTAKVELTYIISKPTPSAINIELGTNKHLEQKVKRWIEKNIDLSVSGIIKRLTSDNPSFLLTSTFGSFGYKDKLFRWEKTDLAEKIKEEIV